MMLPITSDPVVGPTILVVTFAAGTLLWRRGVQGRRFAASMLILFCGIALTLMLTAHCAEIVYRLMGGRPYNEPPLMYNFRVYSLLLLGVLLVRQGIRCIQTGLGVSRGEWTAQGVALRELLIVLALVVPIIPIHPFFGPLSTGTAILGLIGVALARGTETYPLPSIEREITEPAVAVTAG